MAEHDQMHDVAFFRAFQRPAYVVMMAAQMILGLALAISLIVKFYMLAFGTELCTEDGVSLANMIRCTPLLVIVGHFVLGVAAFRFASFMFQDRPRLILGPLMLGLSGTLVLFLSGLNHQTASWSAAAVIVTLMLAISAIIAGQVYLSYRRDQG